MADDNSLIIKIAGKADEFIDELDKVKKETKNLEKVLTKTAKISAAAFVAFAGSIALVTKSFANYEKALVGVGKTTNIEGKRLQKFGKEFQKLSTEIPISTNELLGIAQAAGQLGVKGEEDLLLFTETVAKLGVATDLSGEQAAIALTRILNVTGESISSIDNFGSVIVQLGNNFAATESEIVRMTTEVARSTAVFGVTAAQAAGMATALKSVGVQAQLGGSAVGRAFRSIDASVRTGGKSLENLAEITGMTGAQLKKTFKEDSTAVFQAFISGLGDIQREGGDTTAALASFGLKGDEILKVLPVLAKNSQLVGKALKTAADETKNATALNDEAAKAFATLDAELVRTGNNFTNLKTNIGEQLAPQITELLVALNRILKAYSELDKETLSLIASFLKWGAIIAGTIATVTAAVLAFLKIRAAFIAIKSVIPSTTTLVSAFHKSIAGITNAGPKLLNVLKGVGGRFLGLASLLTMKGSTFEAPFDATTASTEELTRRISGLKHQLEDINELDFSPKFAKDAEKYKKAIQDEIDLFKKLKAQKEDTDTAFEKQPEAGKGVLAIEAEKAKGFEVPDFGIKPQAVPLTPEQLVKEGTATEATQKEQDEKNAIISEATQKRIDLAKTENEDLKALQKERTEGATEEELAMLQRRQDIEGEFAEARNIKNLEERELALENLKLKHEEELLELDEFDALKNERDQTKRQEKVALDKAIRTLDKKQQLLFNKEDREIFQKKIDTKKEAERKNAEEKLNRQIRERNQFLQDEIKHGTAIATMKKFFASEEVQGFKSTSGQLAQLANSKNSTMKGIGKAAAHTNAAIATAEGAIKAYASLSGIPIVGPALGAVAAAALIAYGGEQQANIARMATGGFVPPTSGGARDRFPAMLEPNELVVPAAVAPNFIQAAGIPDTQGREAVGDQSESGANVLEIVLEDRAAEMISLEQKEGQILGTI